jgi:hypothetical protein
MIGNTATIYGSYMYPASTGPRYIPGGSTNAIMCLVVAGLALLLRFLHIRENKKLEKAETDAAAGVVEARPRADQPAPGFRYIY